MGAHLTNVKLPRGFRLRQEWKPAKRHGKNRHVLEVQLPEGYRIAQCLSYTGKLVLWTESVKT